MNFTDIVWCAPKLEVQITIAICQALFWYFFIPRAAKTIVVPYFNDKPKQRAQFAHLSRLTFKKSFFIDFTEEEAFDFSCEFIPILFQHGIGGALCIPAVFGLSLFAPEVSVALACHGALCEVGWELQDGLQRIYAWTLGTDEDRKKTPLPLCVIMLIHHTLGMSMVIPMNLFYPDNHWYHETVFLLQFAAFVAMGAQNYGYLLDLAKPFDVLQMKFITLFVFLIMLYSRCLRFVYVVYNQVFFFYSIPDMVMMTMGGIGTGLMSILGVLFLLDASGKLAKFWNMAPKLEKAVREASEEEKPMLSRQFSEMGADMLSSSVTARAHRMIVSRRGWAKMRGAVHMGAVTGKLGKLGKHR